MYMGEQKRGIAYQGTPTLNACCIVKNCAIMPRMVADPTSMTRSQMFSWIGGQWYFVRTRCTSTSVTEDREEEVCVVAIVLVGRFRECSYLLYDGIGSTLFKGKDCSSFLKVYPRDCSCPSQCLATAPLWMLARLSCCPLDRNSNQTNTIQLYRRTSNPNISGSQTRPSSKR